MRVRGVYLSASARGVRGGSPSAFKARLSAHTRSDACARGAAEPDSLSSKGYVVFPRKACKGSTFNKKCYCWDQNLYIQGKDPKTSEAFCDNECILII